MVLAIKTHLKMAASCYTVPGSSTGSTSSHTNTHMEVAGDSLSMYVPAT